MPANKHLPSVQAMFVGVAHSYAASCAIWAQFAIYRPTPTPSCDLSASCGITGEKLANKKFAPARAVRFRKGFSRKWQTLLSPFNQKLRR